MPLFCLFVGPCDHVLLLLSLLMLLGFDLDCYLSSFLCRCSINEAEWGTGPSSPPLTRPELSLRYSMAAPSRLHDGFSSLLGMPFLSFSAWGAPACLSRSNKMSPLLWWEIPLSPSPVSHTHWTLLLFWLKTFYVALWLCVHISVCFLDSELLPGENHVLIIVEQTQSSHSVNIFHYFFTFLLWLYLNADLFSSLEKEW